MNPYLKILLGICGIVATLILASYCQHRNELVHRYLCNILDSDGGLARYKRMPSYFVMMCQVWRDSWGDYIPDIVDSSTINYRND